MKTLVQVVGLCACFGLASTALYGLAYRLSREIRDGTNGLPLAFPTNVEELQHLVAQLDQVKDQNFGLVLSVFAAAYLYKQTFAIPGSVFMNLLAGALFGVRYGLPLVCLLTACGASLCYVLSWFFGRRLVLHYLGDRIKPLQERLSSDHQSLLFVLLSLRLFPMSPNWLLNVTSPILGVPLHLFFLSVLIGLLPYNYLCVQAGLILSELQLVNILDSRAAVLLGGATITTALAAVLTRRYKHRK